MQKLSVPEVIMLHYATSVTQLIYGNKPWKGERERGSMEFCRYYSLFLSNIRARFYALRPLSLVPAMRQPELGLGREEEAGCNFQVKNRKKKRGEWTSGITEGREERANKLLARRKHNCLSTSHSCLH